MAGVDEVGLGLIVHHIDTLNSCKLYAVSLKLFTAFSLELIAYCLLLLVKSNPRALHLRHF